MFRSASRSRSPPAARRDFDARRDDNRRDNNDRSRDRDEHRQHKHKTLAEMQRERLLSAEQQQLPPPRIKEKKHRFFPAVNGPPVKPPVETQKLGIMTAMSRVAQLEPDIMRMITEDVQLANDALPQAVLDETLRIVGETRFNFEKKKDIEQRIDSALKNVQHMAQRSPAHPALNGVAAYTCKEPMKGRLRAAIKKKLQEMEDEEDECD